MDSISEPAEPSDTIEGRVPANDRLAVIAAKTCYPVVIFSETQSLINEFAINLGGDIGDFREQAELAVALQEYARFFVGVEQDSQFAHADNGYKEAFVTPRGQEMCCRSRAALAFANQMAQECRVGNQATS